MSHDDELRSKISAMAETVDVEEISLDGVQRRGRRRTLQARMLAVSAVFVLVVGAAVTARSLAGDNGTVDVASDIATVESDASNGDAGGESAPAESTAAESVDATQASDDSSGSFSRLDSASDSAYAYDGGPNQILPWGTGFVALGQVSDPPPPLVLDGEFSDRFPAEITEAVAAAGATTVEEASAALEEAGLLELATQIVTDDPELLDWYMTQLQGTSRFVAQVSDDGVSWTELSDFALPGDQQWANYLQSDGSHLVVANQLYDEELGRSGPPTISITTDLVNWTTIEVPVDSPNLPIYVQADAYISSLALTSNGWYATVSEWSYIDVWSQLPADVVEQMNNNGWGWDVTEEGVVLQSWPDEGGYYGGESDYASTGDSAPATTTPPTPTTTVVFSSDGEYVPQPWEPTVERIIPWSELPFSYGEFMSYGNGGGATQAFVGDWAGNVSAATAPGNSVECCNLTSTESGLFAISWNSYEFEGDYYATDGATEPAIAEPPIAEPTNTLWFSADGQSWSEIALPAEASWIDAIVSVDGGVLLTGSSNNGQRLWRGDSNGANWQPVTIPELGDNGVWFNNQAGGAATVLDIAQYNYPEFASYEASFSYDGFDFVVGVDNSGNFHVRITDDAGEVRLDRTTPRLEQFFAEGSDGFVFNDDDGNLIVEVPWDAYQPVWDAESAAWDSQYSEEVYAPEYVLVASRDGINWMVEPLPTASPDVYYGQAAINGDLVVVSNGSSFSAFRLG